MNNAFIPANSSDTRTHVSSTQVTGLSLSPRPLLNIGDQDTHPPNRDDQPMFKMTATNDNLDQVNEGWNMNNHVNDVYCMNQSLNFSFFDHHNEVNIQNKQHNNTSNKNFNGNELQKDLHATRERDTSLTNNEDLELDEDESKYLELFVPKGTERNTHTCLRCFCLFVVRHFKFFTEKLMEEALNRKTPNWRRQSIFTQIYIEVFHCVFSGQEKGTLLDRNVQTWPRERLYRLNNILIKWILSLKNTRTGKDLKPKTYKNYIAGLQRAFKEVWNYDIKLLDAPVFKDPKVGVYTVIDNKIREVQANGTTVDSANILTFNDIERLYSSPYLGKSTAKGFLTRLIFNLGFVTGFRVGEMYNLEMKDV